MCDTRKANAPCTQRGARRGNGQHHYTTNTSEAITVNGEDRPPCWPLTPQHLAKIDAALARLDEAREALAICRKLGIPAEAGEQGEQANREFLTAARQQFFPHHP